MELEDTPLYCICRKPYDDAFMIQCDQCKDWFHGSCVGVKEHVASQIERYHCPICEENYGPLTLKERSIYKRIEASMEGREKPGVTDLLYKLKQKLFMIDDQEVVRLHGKNLTVEHFEEFGFNKPIMVEEKDGLGLVVPPSTFSVGDVEKKVGSMLEIDVIDVTFQEDHKMLMREWTDYFNHPEKRERVLNVISLEFSKTDLSPLVEPPNIVKEVSWVSYLWPTEEELDEMVPEKPEVQKYCLMGVRDSYTDFHIDFGGTSVWYHVLKGEKIFFFVEPTEKNLRLFETWESSSKQDQIFFGDMADRCRVLMVKEGQTVFIPTAWIHAVYTPVDSLVFGGNFLHVYNVPLQLEAYELERRLQTNEKYQFPSYETVNWLGAKYIFDSLHAYSEMDMPAPDYMVSGGEALAVHLKKWTQRKDLNNKCVYSRKDNDPAQLEGISYGKLIKELNSILKKFTTDPAKIYKRPKRKGKKKKGKSKSQGKEVKSPVKEVKSPVKEVRSPVKEFKSPVKEFKSPVVKSPVKEVKTPVKEDKQPMLLRLDMNKLKEGKAEEMDEEQRQSVYNFQDEEEDAPPLNILKVRIPKTGGLSSRAEEPKVSPIKLARLPIEEDTNKRKRKHKKSRGDKRSKKEAVSIEDEKGDPGDIKLQLVNTPVEGRSKKGLFGMGKRDEEEDSDKDNLVVDETPNAQRANRTKMSPVKPVTLKLKAENRVGREETVKGPPPPQTSAVKEERSDTVAQILREITPEDHERIMNADSSQLIAAHSMLSLPFGLGQSARPTAPPVKDEEEQLMAGCYQDSEFMYPSFEVDEEEQLGGMSSRVQEKDDNWNPKARVHVPNRAEERVQRTGAAKNQAVASGLAATAKKLEENPRLIKKAVRKTPSGKGKESKAQPLSLVPSTPETPVAGPSSTPLPGPSTSTAPATNPLAPKRLVFDRTPESSKPKCKKYRKGYKTPKQRIAKLIKIC